MNVTQLNALILKKDSNNRLYRGMKCFKEGLVLDIKSIADKEYGSLDIYGKVMSEQRHYYLFTHNCRNLQIKQSLHILLSIYAKDNPENPSLIFKFFQEFIDCFYIHI